MSGGWSGLREGPTRARAAAALERLAARLLREAPVIEAMKPGMPPLEAALMSGLPGVALAHAMLERVGLGAAHQARCVELLERALAGVPLLGGDTSLARGLAGLGFALAHLGVDDDALATIDGRVAETAATIGHFELFHGAAGLLVYAREREHAGLAGRIVAALESTRDEDGAWRCPPDPRFAGPEQLSRYPNGWRALGVAHGVAGAIAALAAAGAPEARASLTWMWDQRCGDAARGWFPPVAGEPPHQRPGWCTGDDGLGASLHAAAGALADDDACARWLSIARDAAARPLPDGLGWSLCHGAAGLLHMRLRLWHATGETVFAEAAERAAIALLELLEPADGAPPPQQQPWSMLVGLPGVALALAAATSDVEPDWDRAFLLS